MVPTFTAVIIGPGREGFVSSSSDHQSISACPNCGGARPGAYCPNCGQNDRDYMRSVWLVAGDYFRDTFEVDSRVFRTLKLLFFKPGQLSIDFSRNRRARYMSPVRLFLFISFVHFGALALMTAKGSVSDTPESSPSDLVLPYPMSVPELDSLFSVEPTQDQIETARARLDPEQRDRLDDILGRGPDDLNRKILASFLATETGESGGMRTILFRLMIELYHDPGKLIDRTSRWASIILVVSLPLYALLLAVVYFDKRRYFVEHLVLVVHMQCLSMVALTIPMFASRSAVAAVSWIGVSLGIMAYYVLSLRCYFQEGWGTTLARWAAFAVLSLCVSMGTGLALLLLT